MERNRNEIIWWLNVLTYTILTITFLIKDLYIMVIICSIILTICIIGLLYFGYNVKMNLLDKLFKIKY